jgi:hypothetical protein
MEGSSGICMHHRNGAKRMDDQRWKELCRLIMLEQDPQKLWMLVSELNQEFEKREKKLRSQQNPDTNDPTEAEPFSGPPGEST